MIDTTIAYKQQEIWTGNKPKFLFEVICFSNEHSGYEIFYANDKTDALKKVKNWLKCKVIHNSLIQRKKIKI